VCKLLGVPLPEWKQPLIVLKSEYTASDEPPPRVTVGEPFNDSQKVSESHDGVVKSESVPSESRSTDKSALNLDDVKCHAEFKEITMKTEPFSGASNDHKDECLEEAQLSDSCKQNGNNKSSKTCDFRPPSGEYVQQVGSENSGDLVTSRCGDNDTVRAIKRKRDADDVS
jgi:hypothetical protein